MNKIEEINTLSEQILNQQALTDAKQLGLQACTIAAQLATENERLTAELEKYRAAERGGQLVVLPIGYMHGRITDQYAKYNLHSIHDICYAGFDGTCEMPHCSGCPIRKMYMIMQDIENQAEAVQKEREPQ